MHFLKGGIMEVDSLFSTKRFSQKTFTLGTRIYFGAQSCAVFWWLVSCFHKLLFPVKLASHVDRRVCVAKFHLFCCLVAQKSNPDSHGVRCCGKGRFGGRTSEIGRRKQVRFVFQKLSYFSKTCFWELHVLTYVVYSFWNSSELNLPCYSKTTEFALNFLCQ